MAGPRRLVVALLLLLTLSIVAEQSSACMCFEFNLEQTLQNNEFVLNATLLTTGKVVSFEHDTHFRAYEFSVNDGGLYKVSREASIALSKGLMYFRAGHSSCSIEPMLPGSVALFAGWVEDSRAQVELCGFDHSKVKFERPMKGSGQLPVDVALVIPKPRWLSSDESGDWEIINGDDANEPHRKQRGEVNEEEDFDIGQISDYKSPELENVHGNGSNRFAGPLNGDNGARSGLPSLMSSCFSANSLLCVVMTFVSLM